MDKPKLTPELIEAGVRKNASEYNARVEAMRALHNDHSYNPPVDPQALSKAAVEATRGAAGLPSMRVYSQDGVIGGDVRMAGRDPEAESQAKKGGRRAIKEAQDEEGETSESREGDGGVQEGQAAFGQQARSASPFAQAGGGHSPQPVGAVPKVEVYPASSKEDAEAQLATFSGPDVISATIRVKYSVVVVRE
jgi:hypothetical protein